jgi:prepilin-type N-terminal cleavage/methylation domain-containing protein
MTRVGHRSRMWKQASVASLRALPSHGLTLRSRVFTRRSCAFTLVEILIVVMIISTLAAAAIPSMSATMTHMRADALAREIATDMRYAQMLAVKTGIRHRISFWPPGEAYAVRFEGSGWELCTHPVTKKSWRIVLDEHSRYTGLTLKEATFGSDANIIFDAYGAPDTGGYVSFGLGDVTRTITVAPLSGKITID